ADGGRGCPRMDELLRLIGLALPDTATMLRLKIVFGGICGLGAGLLFMASGLDGSLVRGALMAACGIVLIGVALCGSARSSRRGAGEGEGPPCPRAARSPFPPSTPPRPSPSDPPRRIVVARGSGAGYRGGRAQGRHPLSSGGHPAARRGEGAVPTH